MNEKRDSIRRDASDALLIYDTETDLPIGQIINLSERGFKIMTEFTTDVNRVYNCRLVIPENIAAKKEIKFLADCRWCRQNAETTWYDSGFYIRKIEQADLKIIKSISRKWMIELSNKINAPKDDQKPQKKGLLTRLFR